MNFNKEEINDLKTCLKKAKKILLDTTGYSCPKEGAIVKLALYLYENIGEE